MDYVRLTTEDCNHNGYQYKEGLNCLNEKFNSEKICGHGGLYFCRKEDVGDWVNYNYKVMYYIWDVKLLDDSKIVDMGNKLKTDKFILINKRIIWNDEEICKLACTRYGLLLKYVNPELITHEICKLSCNQNGLALRYVKPELMTPEICKLAIQKNVLALRYVKPESMTEELCKLAVKKNGNVLKFVKKELMTEEICKLAILENCLSLRFVKP